MSGLGLSKNPGLRAGPGPGLSPDPSLGQQQGGNRPFAFLQANLYVEITTAEGRHFPKLFLMHDIKLWPCGIERPQFKLI